jgi:hypothetical protein
MTFRVLHLHLTRTHQKNQGSFTEPLNVCLSVVQKGYALYLIVALGCNVSFSSNGKKKDVNLGRRVKRELLLRFAQIFLAQSHCITYTKRMQERR